MNRFIDINCDMGESYGAYTLGCDSDLMPLITSANIACGFHAGDPVVMYNTVQLAKKCNVAIGAHPGFPDLNGFGRRNMNLSYTEIFSSVLYQIGALTACCNAAGVKLNHVKPHGALYNMAAKDIKIASAIADAIKVVDNSLVFVGQANSAMITAAANCKLQYANEVFADRAYNADSSLVSRTLSGAVIHDTDIIASRIINLATTGKIRTIDGSEISLIQSTDLQTAALSVCVHGDNPDALPALIALRKALAKNAIGVRGISSSTTAR
ncbi:MAG: 5-oxoprolinase subunit PxpA [Bacillota bacterium]